ncbi:hypothetical protein BpHYR1_032355 [Brachionus plicatilis]|uniref:Uncharacterized protein n=1 Tax=Brachionus plicatilis TaxID=10195 RepID=A0A3M7RU41_BRAPC|nr:hypothetical protein BpHYR1_032355 [Brachionus plicatilis]
MVLTWHESLISPTEIPALYIKSLSFLQIVETALRVNCSQNPSNKIKILMYSSTKKITHPITTALFPTLATNSFGKHMVPTVDENSARVCSLNKAMSFKCKNSVPSIYFEKIKEKIRQQKCIIIKKDLDLTLMLYFYLKKCEVNF